MEYGIFLTLAPLAIVFLALGLAMGRNPYK